jgi:uncharacterized protein (UPF0332 family)
MDFREFMQVAELLADEGSESCARSAVSRAYYAAFHVGRDSLEQTGFTAPRADRAHAFVFLRLSNASDLELVDAGQRLNQMRSWRNKADYDPRRKFNQTDAERAVMEANDIIAAIDSAMNGTRRNEIVESIKTYERDILKEETWRP